MSSYYVCFILFSTRGGTGCSLNIVFFFENFKIIFRTLASLGFPALCTRTTKWQVEHQCCSRTGSVQKIHKILRKKQIIEWTPCNTRVNPKMYCQHFKMVEFALIIGIMYDPPLVFALSQTLCHRKGLRWKQFLKLSGKYAENFVWQPFYLFKCKRFQLFWNKYWFIEGDNEKH